MSIELFKKSSSASKKRKTEAYSSASDRGSSSSENDDAGFAFSASDSEIEAAHERLKEAKSYLYSLEAQVKKQKTTAGKVTESFDQDGEEETDFVGGEFDAAELDRDIIANRLQQDTKAARGKQFECAADRYTTAALVEGKVNSPDGRVATGVAFGPDGLLYIISKGNCVYQYKYTSEAGLRKLHVFKSGADSLLSIALSSCGTYLAAGSQSGAIFLWSIRSSQKGFSYKALGVFKQHREAVLALAFRLNSASFYSASADRTVKVWSAAPEPMYIDTLFGHQDSVPALACLARDTCMTVGCRDRTARLWKIAEETQLIFRASENAGGSLEALAMISEDAFVTGSDTGALSLWSTRKKKPTVNVFDAHFGYIGAVATLPFTDLVASAGSDGKIKLWRAELGQTLTLLRELPCTGIVTSLQWSPDGKQLAACVGREPRLGRWEVQKSAKNSLHVYDFGI